MSLLDENPPKSADEFPDWMKKQLLPVELFGPCFELAMSFAGVPTIIHYHNGKLSRVQAMAEMYHHDECSCPIRWWRSVLVMMMYFFEFRKFITTTHRLLLNNENGTELCELTSDDYMKYINSVRADFRRHLEELEGKETVRVNAELN